MMYSMGRQSMARETMKCGPREEDQEEKLKIIVFPSMSDLQDMPESPTKVNEILRFDECVTFSFLNVSC